ncbi:MAG: arylsulfatase, partial [Planctomycetes bacterium]|nr:arylsulfatase [Planctomycetota bacterium]
TGQTLPSPTEGISYLPTLLGREDQQSHDHLVWEFFEYGGQQAVIQGRWKAIRQKLHKRGLKEPIQLFDLDADPGEKIDLSADHPDIVARLEVILLTDRSPNPNFRIDALDD